MIPPKTDPRWKDLLTGKIDHSFKILAAGLMISRLKRSLDIENSPDKLQGLLDEAYEFFVKFEKILTDDIKIIFK